LSSEILVHFSPTICHYFQENRQLNLLNYKETCYLPAKEGIYSED
jgi:hypothetical protein